MSARSWSLVILMTSLLRWTGCSGRRCPPCVQTARPPAEVVVRPEPPPCDVPEDPAPIKLGAVVLAIGLWQLATDPTSVPEERRRFVSSGHALVSPDAMRALGLYLAQVRDVIAAQRTCIEGRATAP